MGTRRRSTARKVGIGIAAIAVAFFFLFPIGFMYMTSIRNEADILRTDSYQVHPTLHGFELAIIRTDYIAHLKNSLIIVCSVVALGLVLGVPAGWALARLRVPHARDIAFFILSARFGPAVVVVIPFFILYTRIGIYDTYLGLVLVYLLIVLPLNLWVLRSYFREIPVEIEESAMIDGCSRLSALWRVELPLMKPGIAGVAVLSFILAWNEFFIGLTLTQSAAVTIPVANLAFYPAGGGTGMAPLLGPLAATGVLTATPAMIFALIVHRHIIRGLTFGAVKG